MTFFRHACDVQARCLQSDQLESRCDYVVYNMAAWRLGGKVLLTFVALLAWVPILRSMQAAATEEHLLSVFFDEAAWPDFAASAPLGAYAAVFHLRLALRARREALAWAVVTANVALVASKTPAAVNSLLTMLGLSLFAAADRLWAQLLLGSATYAELRNKVDLHDVPQPKLSDVYRALVSVCLMLLLSFHFEEAMHLSSPVLEAWGSGRGLETRCT